MEVGKPPHHRRAQPATFSGGSQSLGLQAERLGSGPGGPDYSIVWEELNASISASTTASERHLWEQNHRKRKKPASKRLVSGRRRSNMEPHPISRDLLTGGELSFPEAQSPSQSP